jgi:glutathione S-transferase
VLEDVGIDTAERHRPPLRQPVEQREIERHQTREWTELTGRELQIAAVQEPHARVFVGDAEAAAILVERFGGDAELRIPPQRAVEAAARPGGEDLIARLVVELLEVVECSW